MGTSHANPPFDLTAADARSVGASSSAGRTATARPITRRTPDAGDAANAGASGVTLRLAIGRGGIGIELARPARLGCLAVTELSATLPDVRFPLDVSGGVARFRHRRGTLRALRVEGSARALEAWVAVRLEDAFGPGRPDVWVRVRPSGVCVCVSAASRTDPAPAPMIAFDVDAQADDDGDIVLVVTRARGADLPAPATTVAIVCAQSLLRGMARRRGAVFVVRRAGARVARALFPEAGARVPAVEGKGWELGAGDGVFFFQSARDGVDPSPHEGALRAREAAALLSDADDALVAGDVAGARALCLALLERAPRHAEVLRRLAEIDASAADRTRSALAFVAELGAPAEDTRVGTLAGELSARLGDLEAAREALERAAEAEPAPALAARALAFAAECARDADDALRMLDGAVARAPTLTGVRWSRAARRLDAHRPQDALADVEHLAASAHGARAKLEVWSRAGFLWRSRARSSDDGGAAPLFERALRYAPDDPEALGGLGAELIASGRLARGVDLLRRAVEVVAAQSGSSPSLVLDLSYALAEKIGDLPAAIARVSSIGADAPEAAAARGLEGRWRARLGDRAGAAVAFAALRELAPSSTGAAGALAAKELSIDTLLAEAADFHRAPADNAADATGGGPQLPRADRA